MNQTYGSDGFRANINEPLKPCSHCGGNGNFWSWNAVAMWTHPLDATIHIPKVNIWRHQNNENYVVAVTVWTSFKSYIKGSCVLKFVRCFVLYDITLWHHLECEIGWKCLKFTIYRILRMIVTMNKHMASRHVNISSSQCFVSQIVSFLCERPKMDRDMLDYIVH